MTSARSAVLTSALQRVPRHAFAPSIEVLITARALLGIAGATIAPASLGLIVTLFPETGDRARAIGLWMACFMVGIALGPSLGGLLLEHLWWGAVFLPGVVVMLAVLVTGRRALPESEIKADTSLDVAGALLLGTAILSLVFSLKAAVLSSVAGASTAVGGFVLSMLALSVFIWRARRRSHPLIPVSLFAQRRFTAAVGLMTVCAVLIGGTYFYFAQYLQLAAELSPVEAGLVMIIPAVALGLGSAIGPVLTRWITPAQTLAIGLLVAAGGFAVLATTLDEGGVRFAIIGFSLAYLGFGPGAALGTDIIVGTVPSRDAGASSAISETGTELGQAFGIAALGSAGTVIYRGYLAPYVEHLDADQTHALHEGVMETLEQVPGLIDVVQTAFAHSFALIAAGAALVTLVLAALAIPLLRPSGSPREARDTALRI
ncbi:MFS transporter [Micromonospora sp. NPDC050495]|uniref:MFS transporter n=1 Tax=Micromonospora sp. NPDC050495 TaxID=3154936 RepID=UPI0033E8C21C